MAMNKGLRIQVVLERSFRLVEMLDHGALDVAILCRNGELSPPDGMVQYTLIREPMVWAGQKSEDFNLVDEVPLVASLEGCPNRAAAETALSKAGRAYYLAFMSQSWEGVCSAVAAGFGVSPFGRSELADSYAVLGEEHGLPPLPILHTVLRAKSESPVMRQFCQLIRGLPAFREAFAP